MSLDADVIEKEILELVKFAQDDGTANMAEMVRYDLGRLDTGIMSCNINQVIEGLFTIVQDLRSTTERARQKDPQNNTYMSGLKGREAKLRQDIRDLVTDGLLRCGCGKNEPQRGPAFLGRKVFS